MSSSTSSASDDRPYMNLFDGKGMWLVPSLPENSEAKKLLEFAREGNKKGVEEELNSKIKIDSQHSSGETALMCALQYTDIVELLLKRGADPNIKNICGESALHIASRKGLKDVCDLLLHYGADINMKENLPRCERTPLIEATENEHMEVVKLLCDRGADVNLCDCKGWSALFYACCDILSNKELAEFLLARGGNPHLSDKREYTMLMAAIPTLPNSEEDSSELMKAASEKIQLNKARGEYMEIMKLLLGRNIDVNKRNKDQSVAADIALCNKDPVALKLLLDHGATTSFCGGSSFFNSSSTVADIRQTMHLLEMMRAFQIKD